MYGYTSRFSPILQEGTNLMTSCLLSLAKPLFTPLPLVSLYHTILYNIPCAAVTRNTLIDYRDQVVAPTIFFDIRGTLTYRFSRCRELAVKYLSELKYLVLTIIHRDTVNSLYLDTDCSKKRLCHGIAFVMLRLAG